VPDKILELGYQATIAALSAQRDTLSKLRDRAMGLLSAAAIATSLAASAGLVGSARADAPRWVIVLLLLPALLIAVNALYALSAIRVMSLAPGAFLAAHDQGIGEVDAQRGMIEEAITALAHNKRELDRRFLALQVAVGLLVVQLGLIVVAVLVD
jgi:hypothetical protein